MTIPRGILRRLHIVDTRKGKREAAVVIRFLAFTGMRVNEASQVTPDMVDFQNGFFHLPGSITKNGDPRDVPIISELAPLAKQLCDTIGSRKYLLPARDVSKSLETLCKNVGAQRITNHDLRHLFATRCIESGVDIPTVARWLGHKDGGALAMKVYGAQQGDGEEGEVWVKNIFQKK